MLKSQKLWNQFKIRIRKQGERGVVRKQEVEQKEHGVWILSVKFTCSPHPTPHHGCHGYEDHSWDWVVAQSPGAKDTFLSERDRDKLAWLLLLTCWLGSWATMGFVSVSWERIRRPWLVTSTHGQIKAVWMLRALAYLVDPEYLGFLGYLVLHTYRVYLVFKCLRQLHYLMDFRILLAHSLFFI